MRAGLNHPSPSTRTGRPTSTWEEQQSTADLVDVDDILTYSTVFYKDEFQEHPDITSTRALDAAFRARFAVGFQAYVGGDWKTAHAVLSETLVGSCADGGRQDGPSAALLAYMERFGFEAPADWAGHRVLEDK